MKLAVLRYILLLLVVNSINGCRGFYPTPNPSDFAQPSVLTKDVEVSSNGRYFEKAYEKLGQIEYTLKSKSSDDQVMLWDQAIERLKEAALAKYGDKVDAIVDVEVIDTPDTNPNEPSNIIYVKGLAITFLSGERPKPKDKVKDKVKKVKVKYKPKASKPPAPKVKTVKKVITKSPTEEVQITPSELLK